MTTAHSLTASSSPTTARKPRARWCRESGFSLVEVLAVVAIVSILAAVAVPAFKSLVGTSRLTTAANDLLFSLHLARSEAIKRRARVVLCKTSDGTKCSVSGGWEQGWMVFHDANNNGDRESGEAVIQQIQPVGAGLRLTGNLPVARFVSYIATGSTKTPGGAFQAGTLTVCSESVREARQIVLSAVGRPRVQKVKASSACA